MLASSGSFDLVWHMHNHPARLHQEAGKHSSLPLDVVINGDGSVSPKGAPHLCYGLRGDVPAIHATSTTNVFGVTIRTTEFLGGHTGVGHPRAGSAQPRLVEFPPMSELQVSSVFAASPLTRPKPRSVPREYRG